MLLHDQNYPPSNSCSPQLDSSVKQTFSHGSCHKAHLWLGARTQTLNGVRGIRFAVWAPNAEKVSVVGDFNHWDANAHRMPHPGDSGVWETFIPGVPAGSCYKLAIQPRGSDAVMLKADPYARASEMRPATASLVCEESTYAWGDARWLENRARTDTMHAPLSIYELHLGSWRTTADAPFPNYRELAHELVDYLHETGFTHIQLMPIMEHPFDASWGYQVTGFFAPTSRYGSPDDLRYFIDHCHRNGIGVLLDWVPGHFPKDDHALSRFDGTCLYEHQRPEQGEHPEWGTLQFNYGRTEVKNFLLSSAYYWLSEFHFDGLRIDAVASMLYLDYARKDGQWIANQYGGNENLEAIAFLRELNTILHAEFPGALIMAEESTAWPMVSRPVYLGGLGFSMKWNMGWMNDTLSYMGVDPIHRKYHHEKLTFSLLYAFTENFILPLSHDEVVHGKRSLVEKMPGDPWRKFANLRALYLYFFTHPGSKLLFMGNEIAQYREWDHERGLDWELLARPEHLGIQQLVTDLNRFYTSLPALYRYGFEEQGFQWLDCHDHEQSVLVYLRQADNEELVIALNLTPVPRDHYRIPVPGPGHYSLLLDSDSRRYGGSDYCTTSNSTGFDAQSEPWQGQAWSLSLSLPPLGGVILQRNRHGTSA